MFTRQDRVKLSKAERKKERRREGVEEGGKRGGEKEVFLKIDLFIICKYTVAVFSHPRRGHQISLRMVVSHHVVAGI